MVQHCCVCKKSWGEDLRRSFHRFPKDKSKRDLWLKAINKIEITKSMVLCSDHFSKNSYKETIGGNRTLKRDAIPRLDTEIEEDQIDIVEHAIKIEPFLEETETNESEISSNNNQKKRKHENNPWADETDVNFLRYKKIEDVNWDTIAHSPKKTKLCWEVAVEIIQDQKREIKKLKEKLRMLEIKSNKFNLNVQSNV